MSSAHFVLVAEDDSNDVFFLRRAFAKAGLACRLFDVPNGRKAVAYLQGQSPYTDRKQYPLPQLVLLDLKMPLMNGFDVLEWLQSRPELRDVPVVVFSSSAQEEDVRKARQLGARDYLVKPSDQEALVELARSLKSRWLP